MKNIQIIDGAVNCVYDIFSATEKEFEIFFAENTDIAFIDEIYNRNDKEIVDIAFASLWKRRLKKSTADGIHGTIFYELNIKKKFYPSRRDEEAINPDGSALR